jgi:hypothetical protein
MRAINEIVVHCTATRPEWWAGRSARDKVNEVRQWHVRDRGWSDIGYHYLIDRDGTVVEGRPLSRTGAHVRGRNTGTIGIALFGGFGGSTHDDFADNFTPEQDAALRRLLTTLGERFPTINKISGHNEYAAKACPTFDVRGWLTQEPLQATNRPRMERARTSLAQSTTMQAASAQIGGALVGGATAVSALDETAQIVALVACVVIGLAALWIMRERIKKWAHGDR